MHLQVQIFDQSSALLWENVVDAKRSGVFYWLAMHASAMQRKTFVDVLVDIRNKQNKMQALNPWSWSRWSRYVLSHQKLISKQKLEEQYPIEVGYAWVHFFWRLLRYSNRVLTEMCPFEICCNLTRVHTNRLMQRLREILYVTNHDIDQQVESALMTKIFIIENIRILRVQHLALTSTGS